MSQAGQVPETCSACGAVNQPGSQFCGSCGTSLAEAQTCRGCGAENPAGQAFCNQCGVRLEAAPESSEAAAPEVSQAQPDGERKQVTVLFADVQGSMDL